MLWNFTVLGEASAQLSTEVKEQFADVAWRQPARLRNRIVHGYWSIDLDIVHTTAQEQLPGFAARLRRVLTAVSAEGDYSCCRSVRGPPVPANRPMMGQGAEEPCSVA